MLRAAKGNAVKVLKERKQTEYSSPCKTNRISYAKEKKQNKLKFPYVLRFGFSRYFVEKFKKAK